MTCGRPLLVKGIIASLQHVRTARSSIPRCDLAGPHFSPISGGRVGSSWTRYPSPTGSKRITIIITLYLKHPTLKQHPNNPFNLNNTTATYQSTKNSPAMPKRAQQLRLKRTETEPGSVNRPPRLEGAVVWEPPSLSAPSWALDRDETEWGGEIRESGEEGEE